MNRNRPSPNHALQRTGAMLFCLLMLIPSLMTLVCPLARRHPLRSLSLSRWLSLHTGDAPSAQRHPARGAEQDWNRTPHLRTLISFRIDRATYWESPPGIPCPAAISFHCLPAVETVVGVGRVGSSRSPT
jgi:hypothetical protein